MNKQKRFLPARSDVMCVSMYATTCLLNLCVQLLRSAPMHMGDGYVCICEYVCLYMGCECICMYACIQCMHHVGIMCTFVSICSITQH